jgi:hypothetical protein
MMPTNAAPEALTVFRSSFFRCFPSELERKVKKRAALRLQSNASTNKRVRRYFPALRIAHHRTPAHHSLFDRKSQALLLKRGVLS